MSVRDFLPRPVGAKLDSPEFLGWLDKLRDRQNIDDQLVLTAPVPGDETYVFDVSANATRKVTLANLTRPSTPALVAQSACNLYAGTGVPSNGDGANGDYYFRSDGGVTTHIYFRSGGAWAGII